MHILHNAELIAWASAYTGPKFHAIFSDPPYGIAFMGKTWDQADFLAWGKALLPLLYPGALVLMFGGTRMWHRLAAGMEDAGFEMLDTLMWVYGSGFPKSHDISLRIDKLSGAPDRGRAIPAASTHFPTGKYVKEKLTGNKVKAYAAEDTTAKQWAGYKSPALKPAWEPILLFRAPRNGMTYAELALQHGSGALNVGGCRIGTETVFTHGKSVEAGKGHGITGEWGSVPNGPPKEGRYPANLILDEEAGQMLGEQSRFFYCSKASRKERGVGNNHPCVKPISLTTYLAKLLLPPDCVKPRRILVPFSGSGSEMIGCNKAGWDEVVGVEQDKHYCEIAEARITNVPHS